MKGLVIAGTHSGVGKTTIALGLMAAFRRRGLHVAPFKVGPDFIDPGHHVLAAGRTGCNLDGWMLSREYNRSAFHSQAADADVAVVEGVMGLFDGYSGVSEAGSTAQMAKWLELPVLLVVDAAGLARSAAALIQGFTQYDPAVRIAGVLFNNLGSPGHLTCLKAAVMPHADRPFLGGLLRDEALRLPERHLGLVTADEHPLSPAFLQDLAERMEAAIDLDRLLASLPEAKSPPIPGRMPSAAGAKQVRIGVARDPAFCFYYPDNLELLKTAGAELVFFSPLNDATLPADLDGLYFGGGYPELHAPRLAANEAMRNVIWQCSRTDMPIYGECGGFMYLCRALRQADGAVHAMCGCFPWRTRMHTRLQRLGYRRVRLSRETILGPAGAELRGHEFHYSDLEERQETMPPETAYTFDRDGAIGPAEGYVIRNTLGSYVHLHWGSRPESAGAFVEACRNYRNRMENEGRL